MNLFLIIGASLSAIAALLHFSCVFWGAPGFRFLGAGDPVVQMVERGHRYPSFVAVVIGILLSIWALYALSGAGAIKSLPFVREVLFIITVVYLIRAIAFPLLKPAFPGNSQAFWLITSGTCLVIGLFHAVGLKQVWSTL